MTASFILSDGRSVKIRALDAADTDALRRALARADTDDLRRRFMGSPPPTRMLVELLRVADGVHDAALGAFTEAGRLVAVAQFDRRDDRPSAEIAIEVAKDFQHCGLGSELAWRIGRLAYDRGIRTFTVNYLAENEAVSKLVRRGAAASGPTIESGSARAEIDLVVAFEGTDDEDGDQAAGRATARPEQS
ncbi:MAG TPA: GNAT family N-acetyltransferase [Mycobacteriales bacterium]|nr:GNAT family N-acetyltransferase [Mycobacteriales bacterium]